VNGAIELPSTKGGRGFGAKKRMRPGKHQKKPTKRAKEKKKREATFFLNASAFSVR
jgi:hypothetical protein